MLSFINENENVFFSLFKHNTINNEARQLNDNYSTKYLMTQLI